MKELSWQWVVLVLGIVFAILVYQIVKMFLFRPKSNNNPQGSLMGQSQHDLAEKSKQDYKQRTPSLQGYNIIEDMNKCLHWDITQKDFYFISYSSKNVRQAKTLKRLLQHNNIHVWIAPDGIPQGCAYSKIIPIALKYAKFFVLLLTPDSAESEWVGRELDNAINNKNIKIKVVLEEFTISDIRRNDELYLYLNKVQVKYKYSELVRSSDTLYSFISE